MTRQAVAVCHGLHKSLVMGRLSADACPTCTSEDLREAYNETHAHDVFPTERSLGDKPCRGSSTHVALPFHKVLNLLSGIGL